MVVVVAPVAAPRPLVEVGEALLADPWFGVPESPLEAVGLLVPPEVGEVVGPWLSLWYA